MSVGRAGIGWVEGGGGRTYLCRSRICFEEERWVVFVVVGGFGELKQTAEAVSREI